MPAFSIAWPDYNTLIVMAGVSVFGASAGLVGSYAVLRRRALLGDALAHAALPGVVLAFLVTGNRQLTSLLVGALATGLLGVAVVTVLRSLGRIKEDAAIGTVLSVFYAAGVVLLQWAQHRTVGGSRAGLDRYILGHAASMLASDVTLIAGVGFSCAALIFLLYKEFQVVSFDPGFARVQGWPALAIDLLLTGLIALIVVAGLPAVGAVLMTALLIIPPAAARLWTDRLGLMLVVASLMGALIGAAGTALSAQFSFSPTGPVVVLTGAVVFGWSLMTAPRRGLLARFFEVRAFRRRLDEQRLLRDIFRQLEKRADDWQAAFPLNFANPEHDSSAHQGVEVWGRLAQSGLATPAGHDRWRLTAAGVQRAAEVELGYRLWELFLTMYPDLAANYVDLDVAAIDQRIPRELWEASARRLVANGRWPAVLPLPAFTAPGLEPTA